MHSDHTTPPDLFDITIIGAGIAGASLAYFASAHLHKKPGTQLLLLEREAQPGMHSTGRSAAVFMESYGSAQVRALTRASRPFLEAPPAGFADAPVLHPRPALFIAQQHQLAQLQSLHTTLLAEGCPAQWLTGAEALALVPVLRADAAVAGVLDPLAADIDVHTLHQGYLRGARQHGAQLRCNAELLGVQKAAHGWTLHSPQGAVHTRVLVNAAGAWADQVAQLAGVAPIGLQPKRRSAFVFEVPAQHAAASAHWPSVCDVTESFYFKPDAGLLLGSPANEDPVAPHDVQPEELDIATGIARIEAATTLHIRRPRRIWAGLRSFVVDGDLVGGFDDAVPGFFWVAAQGGYGIQTSAAMGALCAAQLLGQPRPAWAAAADAVLPSLAPRRNS
jgi:D-arginine dehydrogenase